MGWVALWVVCGLIAAVIYQNKGRSWIVGLLAGVIFGPLGVIFAAITSTDQAGKDRQALSSGGAVKCPHCAELIRSDAKVCKHCQRDVAVVEQSAK